MQTHAPVTLDQFGDVLTDRELAQLVQRSAFWPRDERMRARRIGVSPDLPREIPGLAQKRYRKADVAHWLATGRRGRAV